ncbi:MAG: ABC transporter substrate-binding protein [Ignavibacteria bacterium]|jgi:1,4-dihydroxy-6-naphthoate synthase|nr:ABC transporter substrate-binding protein [Ignavibacteria bacterium]MDH7527885.1 ABC transporter substrate-binding protein [Ignavibacteria bacterium]
MDNKILRVGHSPDPDDAFMFYGLAFDYVQIEDYKIEHILEDIQSLNVRAMKGELEVTAISAHVYPYVQDKYYIMKTGASMGIGYGPILISKENYSLQDLKNKKIAHPGDYTTATLLAKIYLEDFLPVAMPFDEIMNAVENGEVDAGVVIHEGQITYEQLGFKKILDFGELWQKETNLPLPLGLDVVRKDLGLEMAKKISQKLRESIEYGYKNLNDAVSYALKFGRGLSFELGEKFIRMYVNELTIDMGQDGEKALQLLFDKAYQKKLIPEKVEVFLV